MKIEVTLTQEEAKGICCRELAAQFGEPAADVNVSISGNGSKSIYEQDVYSANKIPLIKLVRDAPRI